MPDWERYVRSRLRLPRLSEADASQVVSELAAMLGECEAEALDEGGDGGSGAAPCGGAGA